MKCIRMILALALLLLTGCASDLSSHPERSQPEASVFRQEEAPPKADISQPPSARPQELEPPLQDYAREVPVPEFLDDEQQTLYRHAYQAYCLMKGGETTSVCFYLSELPPENGIDEPETVEVDGEIYYVARGRYEQWSDFEAMLSGLFTQEYSLELTHFQASDNPEETRWSPIYIRLEDGRMAGRDMSRGSNIEYDWCETPDSFELVSQTENEIVFHLIGHYTQLDYTSLDSPGEMPRPVGEYTRTFPIRMECTSDGWRFAQFHLPW